MNNEVGSKGTFKRLLNLPSGAKLTKKGRKSELILESSYRDRCKQGQGSGLDDTCQVNAP